MSDIELPITGGLLESDFRFLLMNCHLQLKDECHLWAAMLSLT